MPGRIVALTPLLLFSVQEHVEYALGHGRVSVLVLQPAFLLGLLLQVPFAVAAWVAAAVLLRLAAAIARRFGRTCVRAGFDGRRPAVAPGRAGPGSFSGLVVADSWAAVVSDAGA